MDAAIDIFLIGPKVFSPQRESRDNGPYTFCQGQCCYRQSYTTVLLLRDLAMQCFHRVSTRCDVLDYITDVWWCTRCGEQCGCDVTQIFYSDTY